MILYKIILHVIKEITDFHHYSLNFCANFLFCFLNFSSVFDKNILIKYELIKIMIIYV